KPAFLYNSRIVPVVPFGIKGVIWYQGETNIADKQYALKQQILIEGWRKLWDEGDFPFYIVQLAPCKDGKDSPSPLPDFWMQQYKAARKTSNTGLISAVEIGDSNEYHPKNKRDVGLRLALLALRDTYGMKDVVASGPTYKWVKIDGEKIVIAFDNTGIGLTTKNGQVPNWIEVADADKKFVKAKAVIQDDTIVINASPVKNPVYVRYAWDCLAIPNLCNKEGLPAFPFNTAEPFFQQR
ncbi:MAG: sialate O-acetylesterase, partial [Victivallales bacterium]